MKILLLILGIAFLASCNNTAHQNGDGSDTTIISTDGGDMNTAPGGDTNQNSIGDTSTFEGAMNDSVGR